MEIGIYFLVGLGILITLFLITGYSLPTQRIAKVETEIAVAPSELMDYLSRIEHWKEWRPMPEMIEGQTIMCTGEAQGVGGKMSWKGGKDEGSIEITDLQSGNSVSYRYQLGLAKGMLDCEIIVNPTNAGSVVVSKAKLNAGNMPATRILTWMMESVVRKDLKASSERLRLIMEKN